MRSPPEDTSVSSHRAYYIAINTAILHICLELLPLLSTKAISLKVKGELYAACVPSVMLCGSETWPIKVEESQRLHRNEMSMIRWMCGVTMRDRYPVKKFELG